MSQSLFSRFFSSSVAVLLVTALIVSTIPAPPVAAATDTIGYTNKQAKLYKFVNKKLKAVKTVKKNMTFLVLRKSSSYYQVKRSDVVYYIPQKDITRRTAIKPASITSPMNVLIQATESSMFYVWKNGQLNEYEIGLKNKTYRPYRISGNYFVVYMGNEHVYIPFSSAKVVLRNVTDEDFKDPTLAPFISYYYSKQSEKKIPYYDRSNNSTSTINQANQTIKGLWTVPAPPSQFTVTDVSSFNWTNQIPKSSSNSFPFQIHGFYMLDTLTSAYTLNGNEQYLAYGRDMIKSWDPKFPVDKYKTLYKWAYNDHGAALRTIAFINYWNEYRFSNQNTNAAFHSQLLRMIYEHAELLATDSFYRPKNNHGIFQDLALLMVAETFPEMDQSQKWKKIAKTRFAAQIDHGISATGLHMEHSPSYHLYIYQTLSSMVDWIEQNGYDLDEESKRRIRLMPTHMTYMLKPNLKFVQFGDTYAEVMKADAIPYIEQYPELLYSLSAGAKGTKPEKNIIQEDNQYVFFRQHWGESEPFDQAIAFAMTAGFHGMPHKHFDDLSIDLYGFGGDYIVETGRYGYARAPERYGVFDGDAHNSIQIEGEQFPLTLDKVGQSGIIESKQLPSGDYYTVGKHSLMTGTTHQRAVWYDREQTFVIHDTIAANEPKTFLQRFHLAPGFEITKQGENEIVATNTDGRTLHLIQVPTTGVKELTVGDSHVSYADYTWFPRKQIITKQVMNNGEYITVIHLGKTPTDIIQATELTTTDAGRMLRYDTPTESHIIELP